MSLKNPHSPVELFLSQLLDDYKENNGTLGIGDIIERLITLLYSEASRGKPEEFEQNLVKGDEIVDKVILSIMESREQTHKAAHKRLLLIQEGIANGSVKVLLK